MFAKIVKATVVAVVLAACSRSGPAPVEYRAADKPVAVVPTAEQPAAPAPAERRAKAALPPAPNFAEPAKVTQAALSSGLSVRPEILAYEVKKGESVYALSRRFGVSIRQLIVANGLKAPYRLNAGRRLKIPGGKLHTVGKGETIYAISRQYRIDMRDLVMTNKLRAPYEIKVGQKLRVPSDDAVPAVAVQSSQRPVSSKAANAGTRPTESKSQPPWRVARSIPKPPKRVGRFAWPVKGRVLSKYGPKPGGSHNDGVNIAVPRGTPVRAAENGVVAYIGNELRGFGNLLLLRHGNRWMTAYAHADKVLVRVGQKVKQGEVIAHAGSTGNVSKPQLHFEIRRGVSAVNPLRYL